MSPLIAITVFLGCARTTPEPTPRTALLLATFDPGHDLSAFAARGVRFNDAWAHSPSVRPALASLLTGRTPETHGVTDPIRHALLAPTVATKLAARGWRTARGTDTPLFDDETWGFATEGTAYGRGSFTWLHDDDGVAAWLEAHPDGHAFLTTLPDARDPREGGGSVEVVWIGPTAPAGTTSTVRIGHTSVGSALEALAAGRPPNALYTDQDVVLVDAIPRLAAGGSVHKTVRSSAPRTTTAIPLPAVADRVVPASGSLPTDPLGSDRIGDTGALDALRLAAAEFDAGRMRYADGHLDRAEQRAGRTYAGDVLRARVLQRRGRPHEALERLRERHAQSPSDALAFEIATLLLDQRQPDAAAVWLDDILAVRPNDPVVLDTRLRVSALTGDASDTDDLHARLWLTDPTRAKRAEVRHALDAREPVPPEWETALVGADADSRLLRARIAWSRGAWIDALASASTLLEDHPRHIDTRLQLTTWLLELGDAERAVRLVGPVARWYPDDLRVSTLDAIAHDALKDERRRLQGLRGVWRGRP